MFGGLIGPEHFGKFLRPFDFSFVLAFAQVIEEDAVANFSLVISL